MTTEIHSIEDLESFEQATAGSAVLVQFTASWCSPCRALSTLLEELAPAYQGRVDILKVSSEEAPEIANLYNVRSVPTVLAFRAGKVVATQVGFGRRRPIENLLLELAEPGQRAD